LLISSLVRSLHNSIARQPIAADTNGYTGPPICVVSATRLTEKAFWQESPLGATLGRANFNIPMRHLVRFENSAGLPAVYNAALDTLDSGELVVFVHDDVSIYDFFLPHRVHDGLRVFDVIGPAGNASPADDHCSWYLRLPVGEALLRDAGTPEDIAQASGAIVHFGPEGEALTKYGPSPKRVALLDGLFLAARVSTLRKKNIRFDERFKFHFYDLDFCRTCVTKGCTLGTWPIALGHGSGGSFNSPAWLAALGEYRTKWGVTAPAL
jgi:hypothetical protein